MTKQEALQELMDLSIDYGTRTAEDIERLDEAVDMAIKALEQTEVIRCKDCKHRHLDGVIWDCPFGLSGGEDFFCAYGAKDGKADE